MSKTACELFIKGQRVKPSAEAVRMFGYRTNLGGKVVGFSRSPYCIRILRDGRASPDTYHIKFWGPA